MTVPSDQTPVTTEGVCPHCGEDGDNFLDNHEDEYAYCHSCGLHSLSFYRPKENGVTMNVTIIGPNLNDQRKGQFHVHATGCGDLRHYGPGTRYGGEDGGWTIDAKTALDVSAAVYADHLSDYGLTADDNEGKAMLDNWLSDFHFAPCCKGLG